MNFIKKIFDGKCEGDERVHLQFEKFSKGEFKDKAVINVKKTGNKFTINTSYEFANEFVRVLAEKLGNRRTQIKGAVVSTSDLTGQLDFQNKKQFMGIKQYIVNKEMSGDEIISLLNKFPKAFFALSFCVDSGDDYAELKIKPKAPKSSKPSNKGKEKPKPDFCKFITRDVGVGRSFVFEIESDFKKAEISHDFIITDLIIPDELKKDKEKGERAEKEKDFVKIRELAKRKGKIIRKAEIDGKQFKKEVGFVV